MSAFDLADYWYWWVLAFTLFMLELVMADLVFMSLAVAATVSGIAVLFVPHLIFAWQFLLFSVLSIIGLVMSRFYLIKTIPLEADEPLLESRGASFVGRVFTLAEPINNGVGRVLVDGSYWRVLGPDTLADTRVQVVGVSDTALNVLPVEPHTPPVIS